MSQPTCRFNGFIVPSISEYVCTDEQGRQVTWFSNLPPHHQKIAQKSPEDYLEQYIVNAHDDVMFLGDDSATLYERCRDMKEDLDELTNLDPKRAARMKALHFDMPCKDRFQFLAEINQMQTLGKNIIYVFWAFNIDPMILMEDANETISALFGTEYICTEVARVAEAPAEEILSLDLFQ